MLYKFVLLEHTTEQQVYLHVDKNVANYGTYFK